MSTEKKKTVNKWTGDLTTKTKKKQKQNIGRD